MKIHIKALTDKGHVRENNEDSILIGTEILKDGTKEIIVDLRDNPKYFIAIADGMGGHNAGEVASEMVLQLMCERIENLHLDLSGEELANKIKELAHEIHFQILEEGKRDPKKEGMGTTLIGVLFYNDSAYYINVGDSRLYRLRDSYLIQISKDHSLKELIGDENVPSNIILNSFGGGDKVFIDFAPVGKKLFDGDVLLLCSDGLSDVLTDDEMEAILNTNDNPLLALISEAEKKGSNDNISIILCYLSES